VNLHLTPVKRQPAAPRSLQRTAPPGKRVRRQVRLSLGAGRHTATPCTQLRVSGGIGLKRTGRWSGGCCAQATRDGRQADAVVDQLGGVRVAELVQGDGDASSREVAGPTLLDRLAAQRGGQRTGALRQSAGAAYRAARAAASPAAVDPARATSHAHGHGSHALWSAATADVTDILLARPLIFSLRSTVGRCPVVLSHAIWSTSHLNWTNPRACLTQSGPHGDCGLFAVSLDLVRDMRCLI
jgi:hypothetical protein